MDRADQDHLVEQAERAWRWANSIPDPWERRRLESVAREYEAMAEAAEREVRPLYTVQQR
jgi:hypothetical protein